MLLVGLTGGIGSGKSTVARMLARHGAVVFDADELARRALDPGMPGHDKVVSVFGPSVVGPSGVIDRDRLARRVFADRDARRALESIVHPEVFRLLAEGVERYRNTRRVVVFDAPLIVETGFHEACDVVVVVAAAEPVRVARLVADRGMSEDDARARIAAQAADDDKERVADVVVRNDGTREELQQQVDELWRELEARATTEGTAGRDASAPPL